VGKPERFLRRLFQAAVEIIKKKLPKASFADFHSCGSFHSALPPVRECLDVFCMLKQ
jgi:hypothetical protein